MLLELTLFHDKDSYHWVDYCVGANPARAPAVLWGVINLAQATMFEYIPNPSLPSGQSLGHPSYLVTVVGDREISSADEVYVDNPDLIKIIDRFLHTSH